MRQWVCSECGVLHDRDANAAKNILSKLVAGPGQEAPLEGIPAFQGRDDVKGKRLPRGNPQSAQHLAYVLPTVEWSS
jgi:transposase